MAAAATAGWRCGAGAVALALAAAWGGLPGPAAVRAEEPPADAAPPASGETGGETPREEAPEATGEETAGRLGLEINGGRPIAGTATAVTVAGATGAPPGSRVRLRLAGVTHFATVGDDRRWSLTWPEVLPPGEHELVAEVVAPDGRSGRARHRVLVEAPGRLPRRPTVATPWPRVPSPASRAADFQESTDRWRIVPPPYELNAPSSRWDPYNQNVLKGDLPILGDDRFLVVTAISDTLVELRALPTPAGVSTAGTDLDFFGSQDQSFLVQNVFVSADFFRGDTAFKPFDWRIKLTLAANLNRVELDENALVQPDVRRGTNRDDGLATVQEAFVEAKLADLSPHYDFLSLRVGIQPFTSDFRGFIFSDTNLGARLFGNLGSNRHQFNLAWFERLEKDTNSGLNTFRFRDQQVGVANWYRQDFPVLGLTSQASLHYLRDEASFHFDDNEFLVRPDPAGDFTPHEIEAVYLGAAAFGHVGRINVDAAVYWVTGDDSLNPIAGRQLVETAGGFRLLEPVDIEAAMAAVELSMDRDWLRPKLALFWASGDGDLNDRDARGFAAIFDNPAFAGGGFSFWNRMGIRLASTGVALVNRGSLLPDLRSSKDEGQPNFVNPGLRLGSLGLDVEVTPELRAVATLNYLEFDATEVLEGLLFQGPIDREIGWDLSVGARWRPYLNENFVVLGGAAAFRPGRGFEQIFEDGSTLFQLFGSLTLTF